MTKKPEKIPRAQRYLDDRGMDKYALSNFSKLGA